MVSHYRDTLVIPLSQGGTRLDKSLAGLIPNISRSQLTKWIREGALTVDKLTVKPNFKLLGGETVDIDGKFEAGQNWDSSLNVVFETIYEDEDILVIDKPAGLVVHPGAATVDPTLANGLLGRYPELANLPRAGIVHRLDKNTSGVLVVSRSELARQKLIKALAKREISRHYIAIVEGKLAQQRVVNLPLGRSSRNRTVQTVRSDGREAITRFAPLEAFNRHTLVRAQLQTGRTHQIRVHAARIGLPLVGDKTYGAKRIIPDRASTELKELLKTFPRQALHAQELILSHPRTGENLRFNSPVPSDMSVLCDELRASPKSD